MIVRATICLMSGLLLAGCALPPQAVSQRANCVSLFERYDYLANTFPPASYSGVSDRYIPQPNISQQAGRLRNAQCLTTTDDLDGLEQLGAKLGFRQPVDSGAPMEPTAVHVGILTSLSDVTRVTVFFRNLGYGTRTIGAEQLGRRFYIGPFVSEGAMREAIATAEQAGFVAPYPSTYFRFWPWRN